MYYIKICNPFVKLKYGYLVNIHVMNIYVWILLYREIHLTDENSD